MDLKELTNNTGLSMLILGLPGAGKTASIRNLDPETTLILTSEPQGLETLLQYNWQNARVIYPTNKQEWHNTVMNTGSEPDVENIVVDTLSSWHDLFLESYIVEQKEKKGKEINELGLDMYRVSNLQLQEILRLLFRMPKEQGKNLIMTCHMKYRSDENGKQMKEPALSDNLTNWICRQCSIVLRAEHFTQGKEDLYRLYKAGASGDFGTDKTGVLGDSEPNDIAEILAKVHQNRDASLEKKEKKGGKKKTKPKKSGQNSAKKKEDSELKKKSRSNTSFSIEKKSKKEAYTEYIQTCIQEAPACTKTDARKFAEEHTGKQLARIEPEQYKAILKAFRKKYTLPE